MNLRKPVDALAAVLGRVPPRSWVVLATAGVAVVFLTDLVTPLGFAHGTLYVGVVLIAAMSRRAGAVLGIGAIAAALTMVGIVLSPPAPDPITWSLVLGNRLTSLAMIALACMLGLWWLVRVQGGIENSSARKETEARLARTQQRLRGLADAMPLIVWSARPDGTIDYFTQALVEYTGVPRERFGKDVAPWRETLHPQDWEPAYAAWQRSVAAGDPYVGEFRIRRQDGEFRWHMARAVPVRDEGGRITRWYGSATDIHDNKLLQDASRTLAARLSNTLESIGDALITLDRDWHVTYMNAEAERLLSRDRATTTGRKLWDLYPEAVGSVFDQQYRLAVEQRRVVRFQSLFEPLGMTLEISAFPSDDGLSIYFRDITERLALEEQLRQSQRLESVGQLTGGVAHDFNNLLTVILGNAELLSEQLSSNARLRPLADMIASAAQRGADLTQRLLAFARRQPLEPRAVDINQLVAGMDGLLRRTLGEHIELEFVRGAGLWPALIDPGQLESAVLNLCINARDAMPRGGRLTIETANTRIDENYAAHNPDVRPGAYVLLAVSDTGTGIPPEHMVRLFEPFFTTKEKGKGTGLGLPMVYGFIKQSRGHVKVYSETGQGATIKLYLPRAHTAGAATTDAPEPAGAPPGGSETILLVEDDELVRRYAHMQLVELGYHVIQADNGPAALQIVRDNPDIHLLFTDIVMPGGMSGRQLADAAVTLRPDLKVLYTSGYTENAIVHHGRLDPGVHLLTKPFRAADLARKVREVLAH